MESMSWFAIEVSRRYELCASICLGHKGYDTYVPCFSTSVRRGKTKVRKQEPAFPGYIFGRFNPTYRLPILTTSGVRQIVGTSRQPTPIPDEEIDSLRRAFESGSPVQRCGYLKAGQRVRITAGPLEGLQGVLVQVKNSCQIVVSVHLLQRSVSVQLNSSSVELAKDLSLDARA
jgi:transcription antitermination factor NusG